MIDHDGDASSEGRGRVRQLSGFAVLVIVTFVIYAWRAPELLTKPQFWAEDGVIFFAQQYGDAWPRLLAPYWGYVNFIPRLIAWIASLFDVRHAPFLYGMLGLIVDASCVAYVTRRSAKLFAPIIVWFSLTLMPNDGLYYGYIANIQWFSQFVLIAMCLFPASEAPTRSVATRLWTYALLAACALTGPFSLIVAVLIGVVLLASRLGRFHLPFRTIWAAAARYSGSLPKERIWVLWACALVQLATTLRAPMPDSLDLPAPRVLVEVFGSWSQTHFFGSVFLPASIFVLVLAVGVSILLYSNRLSSNQRIVCVLMLVMAMCELLLGSFKPGAISAGMMGGDRYYFLGKTAAWWAIALIAAAYVPGRAQRTLVVVALMAWVAMLNTNWLRRASLPDLNWSQQAKQINAGVPTPLHVNPWWWDNKVIISKHSVQGKSD